MVVKTFSLALNSRDLLGFESDLYEMARSVKFKRVNNPFQRQLASDAKMINTSASLFVPADKTTNLYKVDSRTYDKLLQDNITASYEKTDPNTAKKINIEAKAIAKKLKLEYRIHLQRKKHLSHLKTINPISSITRNAGLSTLPNLI